MENGKSGWWRAPAFVVLCGCLIALITYGLRTSFGLFAEPIGATRGWSPEVFALAIAIQNIVWGIGQPFAGAIADRYGSARMLAAGGALYALGVALMAVSPTPLTFNLTAGVLVGIGLSGGSFTIVIAALGRLVPEEKSSAAMGLATAAGSLGQFVFAPLGQAFLAGYGWQTALLLLAALMVVVPVLAAALRGRGETAARASDEPALPARDAVRQAFGHGSYLLLVAGFFVCGFHVAFITTHLPAHIADVAGHSHGGHAGMNTAGPAVAAWSLALIGLFNVAGSYGSGLLGGRYSKRKLLAAIYLSRAVVIALFITLPPTPTVVLGFAAAIGVLWLSTVPLTSGLVAVMFGTRHLGTLFGIVFLSHQVGAFLGVWLGGVAFERTGSFAPIWWAGIALAIFAALIHWPIVERRAPRFSAPQPEV
ncbi:Major Facilitator Superfamily [Rubrobacter radiotolerans]|uniref:MFS transporter n=1 Tax=Rubrobacter radiotolerans TaxID=42256 RepID=A0A023X1L4_RUBRA|nr:MFS transporter [Rubrobacter radiotolerans]AHY45910.1 Major Facilitator Superfamily [Rubrobacter radiotolerans]MDX5893324.1 MFS transporter [Rubrobacter radiotolerans]SMC03504.1 Predicted arabinose efflux permease, MFS family [Rubrobacter radiotolerans DSM 5868]